MVVSRGRSGLYLAVFATNGVIGWQLNRSLPDLGMHLDRRADEPLYQQIRHQLEAAIAAGQLPRASGCRPSGASRAPWA